MTDVICVFHFGLFFALIQPRKSKIFKKEKTPGDIINSHICTKNYDHMMHGCCDMVLNGQTEGQKI